MDIAKTIYSSKYTEYNVVYTPDVVFAHRETGDLTLQLVTPVEPKRQPMKEDHPDPTRERFAQWHKEHPEEKNERPAPKVEASKRFPLIVDCPGSGWHGQDGHVHVPFMVFLAQHGFAAASISYRGTYRDNVVFPAAVQDLKEAVRFLRANADMYHIDLDRVGLLGDSSGGNTAAMAALTSDSEAEFNIGENLDQSAEVSCCACVYGPVDLIRLVQDRLDEHKKLRPGEGVFPEGAPFEAMEIWQDRYEGNLEECLRLASPYYRIPTAGKLPPFLFVQGDDDGIIPIAQGLRFCDELRKHGGRAEFLKVVGGEHGVGIWSREMLQYTADFFKAYLGSEELLP